MDAAMTTPGRFNDPDPFTEDQVRAIIAAVALTHEAAGKRLALQVQEWSRTRRYDWLRLGQQKRLSADARHELSALADLAEAYTRALYRISPEQRDYLIGHFPGRYLRWTRRRLSDDGLFAHMGDASHVARAALTAKRRVRAGHPPSPFNKAVIVEELARMYEGATQTKATRRVAREAVNGEYDYGPFHEFAAAIWVATFGSRRGLSAAEKEWARLRRQRQRDPSDYAVAAVFRMAEIPRLPME